MKATIKTNVIWADSYIYITVRKPLLSTAFIFRNTNTIFQQGLQTNFAVRSLKYQTLAKIYSTQIGLYSFVHVICVCVFVNGLFNIIKNIPNVTGGYRTRNERNNGVFYF